MKIEQLIVQYLYQHKKVSLQNIGSFSMSSDIAIPTDNEKEAILPDNAIQFVYDTKAKQDDGLIDFIVQQTRKIKPLATSDLESFTILSRQFINIGKPLVIEGLGVLLKDQSGQYQFTQGHKVSHKTEQAPATFKEKEGEQIDFSSPSRKSSSQKWILPLLLIFVVLGLLTFFYFRYNENKKEQDIEKVNLASDTTRQSKDTINNGASIAKDTSASATMPVIKKDSFSFKIVLKEYPDKAAADRAFTKLTSYGHKLVIYPKDSVRYKIAMPFMTALSDTTRAKDSLKIFFGGRPYVETAF